MNQSGGIAYFDLYNMQTNVNYYLGSDVGDGLVSAGLLGYQPNGAQGNAAQGFEFAIPISVLGSSVSNLQAFAMLVNDPGFGNGSSTLVSNQFLTPAAAGSGNYGNGFIDFGSAPPNPVSIVLPAPCFNEVCVTVTPAVNPVFAAPAPICQGSAAPVLPTNSSNVPPITGVWSGPVSNTASGTYTFTPNPDQCATSTALGVTVNPAPSTGLIFHE
jgi:hypothetical protein